ncbi:1,4-dihydroxy-2-naphthoate prenyltransferase [Enterobacillus tribolii]|uniref:1,4-dihydroxy-2-naphthoate prenyltransferase n=1 Tax=Enterobacillus tribolii TaxID=1487935 RepID=A0A370QGM9_9GAMM|nr:1,4-dihydroxy-2-naphthoate prenyltransferase [Enterobacillus tribolii]MBW7981834.1 1,4-dihydroxy-2-naphthoate prenyltransferase [Enterobacillus tribolii]RDK87515.1 hypothetical protein C8D90_109110 [Enterobacillus tribolii]
MQISATRRISWIFALSSWLIPCCLLLWQWFSAGQIQSMASQGAFNMWKMSVLVVDLSLAGVLSVVAVLLGSIALARTPGSEIARPLKRMLELLLLAAPLMVCLFIMGILLVH